MTKIVLACILLVILPCVCPSSALADDADTAAIAKYIAKQAAREHGEEYEDARKIVSGDLDHDGTPEVAVLYTIEGQNGTNNHVQYLAVFTRKAGALVPLTHVDVGGKTSRGVELVSITDNVIVLKTMSYKPSDPSCCPSKEGKARYRLVGRQLKEL